MDRQVNEMESVTFENLLSCDSNISHYVSVISALSSTNPSEFMLYFTPRRNG